MNDGQPITTVPRDESARLELLSQRPLAWEYLLFGYALHVGLMRTEAKWRDYHLGYTMDIGPAIQMAELAPALRDRISRARAIASNLMMVISQKAQDAAFGLPGEPGDPELIEHMGGRLIMMYEQLLDWAHEIRSLRVEAKAEKLPELAVAFVEQPIAVTRSFVHSFIQRLEESLATHAAGSEEPINITMGITFEISDDVQNAYLKELKKAFRKW